MAVVFYMPEAGADDTASGSGNNSSASSSGGSNASSTSQSPNTTTSATQTPMQSPVMASPELLWAMWNSMYRSVPVFQYPPPPSPSPCCSARSPPCTGGEVFFPHSRSTPRTPRTPRTSVSFAAGDDSAFLTHSTPHSHSQPPQSAPAMHSHSHSHSQPQFQPIPYPHYQYTPPPTPLTANNNISGLTTASVSISTGTCMASKSAQSRLQRSHSDAQRRSRRTSTHEVERECHSEHETSWDELDDRYDNFTAGRERLQEFNGRIPPRKKKKDMPKPEKKFQTLIWPTVVSVIVVAIGCGFLVAR